jgi:hypothetical protein
MTAILSTGPVQSTHVDLPIGSVQRAASNSFATLSSHLRIEDVATNVDLSGAIALPK